MPSFHYPDLEIIVLAAGKGTRMRSSLAKVLHPVLGKPMLAHVLNTAEILMPHGISVVIGYQANNIRSVIGDPENLNWVEQTELLGTGHAVQQCQSVCNPDCRDVLIVCGDTPLLQAGTLSSLIDAHRSNQAGVSFLSAELDDATGYGRVDRCGDGTVKCIIEHKDANDEQRNIAEVSSGIFCVQQKLLFSLLTEVNNDNAQQEYYLPDIIPLALAAGHGVQAVLMNNAVEMSGVNNRCQLAAVESVMQAAIIKDWQMQGVTIMQSDTVRIEAAVRLGRDCTIHAGVQLLGTSHLGEHCNIGPYSIIQNANLDDGCQVYAFSHIEKAVVSNDAKIGPFARLRPEARLDEGVRIGNFVEIKKSVIGKGSKVNHLSYIGDTNMGEDCNIGAGTITCNYDGANKHQTIIGDRVFIGSDTKLIAPVSVGDNATVGAGSIISKNVDAGGLTLSARPEQRHQTKWQRPQKS